MPSEIEIKLDVTPQAMETLFGSDLLGEPQQVLRQKSTYFDTADRQLFDRGFTLRVRQTGDVRIQTVKATGESASLFARSEWETPLEQDRPVLDHSTPLENEFGNGLAVEIKF